MCEVSAKIIELKISELVKVFKFSDEIPGFSKAIAFFLNFCVGFFIT